MNFVNIITLYLIVMSSLCHSNEKPLEYEFIQAVQSNNYHEIKLKLNKGININSLYYGSTLFQLSLQENCSEQLMQLLIKNGANPNSRDIGGLTPFITSFQTGDLECVLRLAKFGGDAKLKDKYGDGAVLYAVFSKNIEVVKEAIKLGASIDDANSKGTTPFMVAVLLNEYDIAKLLLKKGARKCIFIGKELFINKSRSPLSNDMLSLFKGSCDI
ncbi:MAG: ankyrin repeat domain-containing protein [Oceanospirillaceae bacterium]|nr:ankyrin repeat domain-containing protein [Oceanospirillaceae bacterium]